MPLHRIRLLGLVVLLVLPPTILAQDAAPQRQPEPDAAAQKQSKKVIRDIFKEEYSKKAPADQQALAKKLLQQGIDTKDDAPTRYVLFQESMEIAAKSGDVETAMAAVTETAKAYEIDGLALKAKTLIGMISGAKSAEAAGALADACLEVIDEAVREEKFDVAKSLVPKAETAAKASKDAAKTLSAQKKGKEIADLQREAQKAKEAAKTLEVNPADPDANLTLGRFLLVKREVEKALLLLSKGADPLLRAAADKELAAPTKPKDQAAVGDAWWEAAEREKNIIIKAALLGQAKRSYENALAGLSGIVKTRIEKRISELDLRGMQQEKRLNLLSIIDPRRDAVKGNWLFEGKMLVCDAQGSLDNRIMIPLTPPIEYDLLIVAQKNDAHGLQVGLLSGDNQFTVTIWDHVIQITGQEKKVDVWNSDKPTSLRLAIRRDSISVNVDDKPCFSWNGDLGILDVNPAWRVPNKYVLFIGTHPGKMVFSKIELLPISGQWKKLR